MGKELFSRYVWLLETIHRAGKITFEEINARWLRSHHLPRRKNRKLHALISEQQRTTVMH